MLKVKKYLVLHNEAYKKARPVYHKTDTRHSKGEKVFLNEKKISIFAVD